ncbi:MAG: peptide chain release factor aRF-1 [Candidatus Micrarchaeaceae archaeon]
MKETYDLLKEIKRLKSIRGYGTELISIYVPAGFQMSEEIAKLRQEYNQSGNIKSKTTRTNVQSAIDKIIQYLKLYRETPKNGLIVFCGNISPDPGREDIEIFSMEPPEPIRVNIYRCDSTFLLDPIETMVESSDTFVLLVLDGREATIATLKGTHIQVIKRLRSMAHAKMKKGGQSARRFARAREEDIDYYYTEISEFINSIFQEKSFKIKGLIIGGPGPTKENFQKAKKLNYQIKILGSFDTGYTDETGLNELVDKASDILKEQEASQERRILEQFIREVSSNGLAVYGYDNTKNALLANNTSTLIINIEYDYYIAKRRCNKCNDEIEVPIKRSADESEEAFEKRKMEIANNEDPAKDRLHAGCGGVYNTVELRDGIEELIGIADKNGTETIFVSNESSYGKEFLMGFGGIGALLKHK